jgi:AcrR family transcriptional regulator
MESDPEVIAATDGRVPGRRGRATRQRLLESTTALIESTPWRSIKVIDIAREAGTSPATFYQYFENVEQAILVLAEELTEGAGELAELVDGDWSEGSGWFTARRVVDGFMDYWERNRAVFRVVELATEEGDLRFRGLRVRALNAVTVTLARVISAVNPAPSTPGAVARPGAGVVSAGSAGSAGADPMAVAATVISMLAHVASHRYGFEFWGIRTSSMTDSQARILHGAVTGRPAPASADVETGIVPTPCTGPVFGGGAAQARTARRT